MHALGLSPAVMLMDETGSARLDYQYARTVDDDLIACDTQPFTAVLIVTHIWQGPCVPGHKDRGSLFAPSRTIQRGG